MLNCIPLLAVENMPYLGPFSQQTLHSSGDPYFMGLNFSKMQWSPQERQAWVNALSVSRNRVNKWCQQSGASIVTSIPNNQTRLQFMPNLRRDYQIRFIAGMLCGGAITRKPRSMGDSVTKHYEYDYFAECCEVVWQIMTHQEEERFLGFTFTSISVNKFDGKWVITIEYNKLVHPFDNTDPLTLPDGEEDEDGEEITYFDKEIPEEI